MPTKVKMNRRVDNIVLSELHKRVKSFGEEVEVNAKGSMKRLPRPSLPGNPPRIDTGKLVASIGTESRRMHRKSVVRVGTNVNYGRFLETGTSKMAPRPWLRPAFYTVVKQFRI